MPLTIPPALTPAPSPAPQRGDSATFSTRVDALMTWLTNAGAQFSALASNGYDNAVIAGSSASIAEAAATITKWISGNAYTQGNVVWSPVNFLAYRCKVTGTYTTDPSADSTNWAAITPSLLTDKDASNGFAGLTLLKINFKNVAGTFISFFTNSNTAARTYTFPDKDGTVAMLSDITTGFISTSPTDGMGYGTGAGGAVTQTTSKSTDVTINKICGKITLASGSILAGDIAFFTVFNSTCSTNDIVLLNLINANGEWYTCGLLGIGAGNFSVYIKNNDTVSRNETLVLRYAIFRSAIA
jgi:hypothetical protein